MLEALPRILKDYWAKGPHWRPKKTGKKLVDPWNKHTKSPCMTADNFSSKEGFNKQETNKQTKTLCDYYF